MKLQEIRKKTAYNPTAKPTVKVVARDWLRSKSKDYPLALTLTLKQTLIEHTNHGTYMRKLKRLDCDIVAERFMQKLNREAFGKRGAEKYGLKLNYLAVVEGERSNKNLHLHFAVGGLPEHIKFNQFQQLVINAKSLVKEIDKEFEVNITDTGWTEYIAKELGAKDTDNVLWHLA